MDDQQVIQQWIHYAEKLARQGRTDEAIQALQRVAENQPQDLQVRFTMIELALQKRDYQLAVAQHMACARLLDQKAAVERYEQLLRLEEEVPSEQAVEVRRLVAQVKPEIYRRIGEFRLDHGNVDQALQYLKKAHELAPGVWQTHLALGRAYLAKEAYKDAIGELQEVLRLTLTQTDEQAGQAQAYELVGEVFVRQGRPAAATITWFERAAELWLQVDRFDEACQAYQRIVAVDPTNQAARKSLGDLHTRLQLIDQAPAEVFDREGSSQEPAPPDLLVKSHFPTEEPQVIRIFKRQPQ